MGGICPLEVTSAAASTAPAIEPAPTKAALSSPVGLSLCIHTGKSLAVRGRPPAFASRIASPCSMQSTAQLDGGLIWAGA